MHIGNQRVRFGGKDRAGFDEFAGLISPAFPQASEGKHRVIYHAKVVRLLLFRPQFFPFVKPVRGNQAAAAFHGITEGGLLRCSLRHAVDGLESDGRVFGPIGDQPPTDQIKSALRFLWGVDG